MKKVLVIYFTQSGQLNNAVRSTLKNYESDPGVEIFYENITPVIPFPFPWTYMQFFNAFPETVFGITCELKPLSINRDVIYDLVIIAYQPWFLSVSRPINSFLHSSDAARLLKDKPVITILACRNMWLNAQEKMKQQLKNIGANLVGNITYVDRSSNLVSLITVLAFTLGGIKDRFLGIFPKYGVPDKELETKAWKYGDIILGYLKSGSFVGMQQKLVSEGAVTVKPNLMIMEGRGKVLFPLYAKFIMKKGAANSKSRQTRVRIFGIVLPLAILLLSPVITIISRLSPLLFPARTNAKIRYYSGIDLNESNL